MTRGVTGRGPWPRWPVGVSTPAHGEQAFNDRQAQEHRAESPSAWGQAEGLSPGGGFSLDPSLCTDRVIVS